MPRDETIRRLYLVLRAAICAACAIVGVARAGGAEPGVGFNRDIRPILSDKCLQCHGPDETAREAELRLDDPADAARDRDGHRAVVAGRPEESEMFRRMTASDPAERMPPAESGKELSPREIELVRRWIAGGGQYEKHWSLIPPARPPLPPVADAAWPRNAIDRFVLARLEQQGLRPSPAAERAKLLRRVSLDLRGLPPTVAELEAYLADDSPQAYEAAVERLLESPRYGEHMARYWLDAARYADTHGFFRDSERSMWRWRDWVIEAFNRNMPFDRFTVEQLAGDLLPEATTSQRIASGFHRNHMTTGESGIIDEEYRVEYVVDRVETTAVVWLGLTMGCARCHDHKYDPISQREFYEFFAFFNSTPEPGLTKEMGNSPPVVEVPTANYLARLEQARRGAAAADEQFKAIEAELESAQAEWERTARDDVPEPTAGGLVAHFDMEQLDAAAQSSGGETPATAPKLQPGLLGSAAEFDGDAVIEAAAVRGFESSEPFSYGAWIRPASGEPACILSKNDDLDSLRGFDVVIRKGKAVAHLIHRWNTSAIQVMTQTSIASGKWQHVMVTYDGSGQAAGVKIYLDGKPQPLDVRYDNLHGSIATAQPLRIGRRSTSAPYKGMIDDVRIYDRQLAEDEVRRLARGQLVRAVAGTPAEQRSPEGRQKLRDYFLAEHAPQKFREASARASDLHGQLDELAANVPTAMVMQELDEPRETRLLVRGQYDQPGEAVARSVPASLPSLPADAPANRLGLARWLVDGAHPLTARVTVNRFWQQYFGTGIVKTVEDFGSQGQWPSHPDLLDWLAVEFVESGWDVKHVQRLIVTSATYRQASKLADAGGDEPIDPENRLLARGPRFRLDAEMVRDNALAIGGLLAARVGGPSAKPYQPPGLWEAVTYDAELTYPQDHGEGLYRRGLYTYWKRQSPPPGMLAFDAPTRETCTVRRPRTNTPLQALTLLNDTTYVEAARTLAERMMSAASEPAERVRAAFRAATARLPDDDAVEVLLNVYGRQLAEYRQNVPEAEKLLAVGESPRDRSLDPCEHAAWTTVASMILNMDETVTKD